MPRPHRNATAGIHAKKLRQSMTDAEFKLWTELRSHRFKGIHFRRQYPIGSFIVDFCAPGHKLVIELDGGQHLDQEGYDAARTRQLESLGYKVLRFWNDAVLKDMLGVLSVIHEELYDPPPASPI